MIMNFPIRTGTGIAPRRRSELALSNAFSNDRNPILVYLNRLAPGSARTMASALHSIAIMASDGTDTLFTFRWPELRYQHTAAIRSALSARYKPATTNKMLAALRGVLKECQKLGWMSAEDFQKAVDIPILKATTLLRGRALTSSQITALQSACSRDPTAAGVRDAAIIGVLYGTGLRRAEIVKLDCSHYKQDANELTVISGKGGKDRLVYVPDGVVDAIKDWLRLRGSDAGPLFCHVNKAGRVSARRLSGQGIWHILRKRGSEAGVESFSPHDLRRSFITDLLTDGADIFVVQQLAGHSDPKTTMRYDRRGEVAKRTAARKLIVPYFGGKLAA
jgi:site-specific recombinase XerD